MEEQQRIPYDVFMAWAMNEEAGDKQPTPKLFLDKLMRTLALNVILQIAILVYSAFLIGYMASNADRTNEASNRHGATYLIVAAVSSIGCILMEICLSVAVSNQVPLTRKHYDTKENGSQNETLSSRHRITSAVI